MSKRNFILLIIIITLAVAAAFGFMYFRSETSEEVVDEGPIENFIQQFNPFGRSTPKPPTTEPPTETESEPPTEETEKKLLEKVSSMPIAGFGVFSKERLKELPKEDTPVGTPGEEEGDTPIEKPTKDTKATKPKPAPTEFVPAVRYVDRALGYIYQTFADKIEEKKFSGTKVPKVYEAYFGNKAEAVIMRYLKADGRNIETFVGNLPKEVVGQETITYNEIKGFYLPNNVKDLSISPNTQKVFYLFNSGENQVGTTLNLLNNKKVQIFDSPFSEWLSVWATNNVIHLSTKPSANFPGHMYSINESGKNLTNVLSNINGLTTLGSPSEKFILYGNSSLALSIYHPDTRTSDLLGIKTLPEKCVWNTTASAIYCAVPKAIPFGEYPDSWYQGEASFRDQIWKIDTKTQNATLLADPGVTAGEEVDGIKLAVDEGEQYLFFVNKKDSFLWKLELEIGARL